MLWYNSFPYNYAEHYRFINRTNETDHVYFKVNTPLCKSTVGKKRKSGQQVARVGGCKVNDTLHFGKIMHELMHVAGMGPMEHYKIIFQ